ncbi:MAG: sulfotransferase [Pseudomonadales bacterium]|nr:sulfotransferase [Pseudomonadales bacterium]
MQKQNESVLPDFIIVGTQKGGTSSVYNALSQHPRISPAKKKEVHYFDQHFDQSLQWYSSHFYRTHNGDRTGEASPFYLFHPLCAERIASILPAVKIIVLLRNPVDRAYSHYQHMCRRGIETLSFDQAIKAEKKRTETGWQKLLRGEIISSSPLQQFSYVRRGLYLEQLLRYENLFPRTHIKVLCSEDFYHSPLPFLSTLYEFLDVDPAFQPEDLLPRKPGNYTKEKSATLSALEDYFAPHNEALFRHLGVRFNW